MALFGSTRSAVTPSTTTGSTDALFITALTARKMTCNEFSLIGNGATSAAAAYVEYSMKVATGAAGAAGTAVVPQKFEQDSATSVNFTNFGVTTDAAAGNPALIVLGCNMYGGIYRWTARPQGGIVLRAVAATGAGAAGSLCCRQTTTLTAGAYTFNTVFDEL